MHTCDTEHTLNTLLMCTASVCSQVPHLEVAGAEARMHHAQPAQHSAPLAGSALGPSGGGSGHDVDMSDCRSDAWAVGVEAGGAGHEHAGYAGYEGYGDAYGQTGHEPLEAVQPPTAPRNVEGGVRIGSVGGVVGEGFGTCWGGAEWGGGQGEGEAGAWEEPEFACAPWLKERRLLLAAAQDVVGKEASQIRLLA